MTRKTFLLSASLVAVPFLASADEARQSDQVSGPVLGYVFDQAGGQFRAVFGIPGAARVGDPLLADVTVVSAEIAGNSALGIGPGGEVYQLALSPTGATGSAVAGVSADRVVISPSGSAAAAYDRSSRSATLLTGLDGDASAGQSVDLSSVPGVLTALAVNDAGSLLLAASASRNSGALSAVRAGEPASPIGSIGRALGIAFVAGSDDAVVADVERGEILRVRNVGSGGEISVLASPREGIEGPVAVAASGGSALAVSQAMSALISVPLSGGAATITDCECSPTTVAAMNGAYRLTSDLAAPLILADVSGADPRILFVPAALQAQAASAAVRAHRGR